MNFDDLRANNRLIALVLIALGALFLGSRIFDINFAAQLWPFFIVVPGVPFLYLALRGGKLMTMFIFPGLVITGTGLILLLQNTLGSFESWAYMWAAYPLLVGFGLRFQGKRLENPGEVNAGRGLILGGAALLLAFGFLFEVLIFNGLFGGLLGILLPFVLIALGGFMLYRRGELPLIDRLRPNQARRSKTGGDSPDRPAKTAPMTDAPVEKSKYRQESPSTPSDFTGEGDSDISEPEPFPWEDAAYDTDDEPDIDPRADEKPSRPRLTGNESATIDPDLQRRIDEALAESDSSSNES